MSELFLTNAFVFQPDETTRIETSHRRIVTPLPAPECIGELQAAANLFPQVNCYQPPIVWDRAEGYQVFDKAGNCWIDFTSTAVTTNTGHAHPDIRKALVQHAESELLAQFSFASEIRVKLARRLIEMAPPGCEKVYFWTVGSEAIEASLRLAREWGMKQHTQKYHILTHRGDYHGWTLGAHQLSGDSAEKPWLKFPDQAIHHLPFPRNTINGDDDTQVDWNSFFEQTVAELSESGITPDRVAAVFIETMQGWGALPLPVLYMQRLRRWADEHDILLIFDEIQTGFGRTGAMFGHEHYGVTADMICIGKGLTSSLPLAAVLGPANVLDVLPPGEIATTHAAHPLSCAAALANLDLLHSENLIEESARKGNVVREELCKLKERFPNYISEISGLGLLVAIHVRDPQTGHPSPKWARDWIWEAVKQGVMLFQTNKPTLKVCPPLTIPDAALLEGISTLGDALDTLLNSKRPE